MASKHKKRISYVLPLSNSAAGHRLGVNGLAYDRERSILYTAGRDGVIGAWSDRRSAGNSATSKQELDSLAQVQAHTHWINDLTLVQNGQALVSASSDTTVKVYRPYAEEPSAAPTTIGIHNDYVKCTASPSPHAPWISAGGLDRRICLWDLTGKGKILDIQVADEEDEAKCSLYALAANQSMVAAGGPEKVIKIWDPKSGKRINKFTGHTDLVRGILLSQDNDMIMSASSDQTVKVWSLAAGRCMYTLNMHNDSVWCLYSDHPQLSVFYSGDRSGFVAKSDTRMVDEMDQGVSVAVCQEHEGVNRIVGTGKSFWASTRNSSVNKWEDIDLRGGIQGIETARVFRPGYTHSSRKPSLASIYNTTSNDEAAKVPLTCVLRMSNFGHLAPRVVRGSMDRSRSYAQHGVRQQSIVSAQATSDIGHFTPLRTKPEETIQGQNGLIRHVLLNNRRRVVTVDTDGEVVLWDLLECRPKQSFGKRHLDEVVAELNVKESIAHWCNVDTRTGALTVVLEEKHCFDAEMYADELLDNGGLPIKEDQRINLGKWVLRYLFDGFIQEEMTRDNDFRGLLTQQSAPAAPRRNHGLAIDLPPKQQYTPVLMSPRDFGARPLMTPGLGIGAATPGPSVVLQNDSPASTAPTAFTTEEDDRLPRLTPAMSNKSRVSQDGRVQDYFSTKPPSGSNAPTASIQPQVPVTPGGTKAEDSPVKDVKTPNSDNRMSMTRRLRLSFTSKKGAKSALFGESATPATINEAAVETPDVRDIPEKQYENTIGGTLQKVRDEYSDEARGGIGSLQTLLTPYSKDDAPALKPPQLTTIIIQEDRPESGGVTDLFESSLLNLPKQADILERVGPGWLGDVLLRNKLPQKEPTKVPFVLEPYKTSLPSIASGENPVERLNANRMLRARRILAYVSERLFPKLQRANLDASKAEQYLDLYCHDQVLPLDMTLATIRAYIWRGGGDVVLVYKAKEGQNLIDV